MVDGAAEGLPTESGVSRIKVGQKIRGVKNRAADAGSVVAASVGTAEVDVGRFAEVAVEAKMADNAGVLAAVGGENVTRIAAENLGRSLEEPVFRGGQEARKGNAGVVDAVFAADEIVGHQRPVDERQGVIVDGVDLAEFGAHLADFQKESGRERSKGDVTFLDVHAFFAEGDKGIGARVGINDGLHADFGFVEFERARWRNRVPPGSADEIADKADVRIEELSVGSGAAISLRLRHLRGRHRLRRGCRGCGAGNHARLHSRGGQQQVIPGCGISQLCVADCLQFPTEQGHFLGERPLPQREGPASQKQRVSLVHRRTSRKERPGRRQKIVSWHHS